MRFAGIIAEYDPFHNGHAWQLAAARRLGAERIAVALSCGLTQRGTLPLLPESVRVEAALLHGADLVVANPAPCACAGAEQFARAGVRLLAALGCDALVFGAETADTARLMAAARVLCSAEYAAALKAALSAGARSFAAARQAAVKATAPGEGLAELLEKPNNNLAIEYCKAILEQSAPLEAVALPRIGAVHNAPLCEERLRDSEDASSYRETENLRDSKDASSCEEAEELSSEAKLLAEFICGGTGASEKMRTAILLHKTGISAQKVYEGGDRFASASALRALWGEGGAAALDGFVPPQALTIYRKAERDGLATSQPAVDLALLSRLRAVCGAPEFAQVRGVSEGLENRLAAAVRTACTAQQLYDALTTVRYPRARMRRLCMDAALGYAAPPPGDALQAERAAAFPPYTPPYLPPCLHVLGAHKSALPLLQSAALPASVSLAKLAAQNEECRAMAAAQNAASDFAALCRATPAPMGLAFTAKPRILPD